MKYCKHCGKEILKDAIVCPNCGLQVEELKIEYAHKTIYNNHCLNSHNLKKRNKWVAFFLCLFFGVLGVHKIYDRKIGMGILYMFTGGLFSVGVFVDLIYILFRKTIYYV